MNIQEISTSLVALCNAGKDEEAMNRFYSDDIVSIEAGGDSPEMPARIQGLEAVQGKAQWWHANHEVHSMEAHGPYHGDAADQFAVRFTMDVTPTGGERMQMDEVALYRVANGKIVEEQFLYSL
ncbi:MAG: SnoaL-like domain-containing protein [Pseudomonadales bacterium]